MGVPRSLVVDSLRDGNGEIGRGLRGLGEELGKTLRK
jgi:hypothetical protein